jgi:hypothetical protein
LGEVITSKKVSLFVTERGLEIKNEEYYVALKRFRPVSHDIHEGQLH